MSKMTLTASPSENGEAPWLPSTLQEEVLYLVHEKLLRKVTFFKMTDDTFIKALVRLLKPQVSAHANTRYSFCLPYPPV